MNNKKVKTQLKELVECNMITASESRKLLNSMIKEHFSKIGKKGGKASTPKKSKSSKKNGSKGGRPKNVILLIFFLVNLIGCNSSKDGAQAPYTYYSIENPTGLVYLFHGLYGKQSDYSKYSHMRSLVEGFNSKGLDVVTVQLTSVPKRDQFYGDGQNYLNSFINSLTASIVEIESQFGVPERRYVSGISMGGFHAMTAFANTDLFQEFWVLKPVHKVEELSEYYGLNPTNLNTLQHVNRLDRSGSFILFDESDTRVNGQLSSWLIDNTENLSFLETFNEGHLVNQSHIDMFLEWFNLELE